MRLKPFYTVKDVMSLDFRVFFDVLEEAKQHEMQIINSNKEDG